VLNVTPDLWNLYQSRVGRKLMRLAGLSRGLQFVNATGLLQGGDQRRKCNSVGSIGLRSCSFEASPGHVCLCVSLHPSISSNTGEGGNPLLVPESLSMK
jgi:hypothetical protein